MWTWAFWVLSQELAWSSGTSYSRFSKEDVNATKCNSATFHWLFWTSAYLPLWIYIVYCIYCVQSKIMKKKKVRRLIWIRPLYRIELNIGGRVFEVSGTEGDKQVSRSLLIFHSKVLPIFSEAHSSAIPESVRMCSVVSTVTDWHIIGAVFGIQYL